MAARSDLQELVQKMVKCLSHRGPDGSGRWDNAEQLFFGHNRLAVIDTSETGRQPMAIDVCALTFNGEIYNYAELRRELVSVGVEFRGRSDTEVLLVALMRWGIEKTITRLDGMYAFAYWDGRRRELFLARDRFGEKPLYYAKSKTGLAFASEIRALIVDTTIRREIDVNSLASVLSMGYVHGARTIYKGVEQLLPGHYIRFTRPDIVEPAVRYWSLSQLANRGRREKATITSDELSPLLESELLRAVRSRMVSDVPIGAFLSGGVDSSLIVALMQRISARPVRTFTIGFWESEFNEAKEAANVARHLGTEHHELYLSTRDALELVTKIPKIYDEPFADSSQIPTVLVSEFTRKHVTVSLSGDGGDELFGGYNRYLWSRRMWKRMRALSRVDVSLLNSLLRVLESKPGRAALSLWEAMAPNRWKTRGINSRVRRLSRALSSETTPEFYNRLMSEWQTAKLLIPDVAEPNLLAEIEPGFEGGGDLCDELMFFDQSGYFPYDILCKVDRASMSCGLETRVPFIANGLVELAWKIPVEKKISDGVTKCPLREVLYKHVPKKLIDRPKSGFSAPTGIWLRGPLSEWARELLSERSLAASGLIDVDNAQRFWESYRAGLTNADQAVWNLVMFQAWYREWM